jgi:hypothetical protein
MTALEDDLRAALRDRVAGTRPDNPARTAQVRARIRRTRTRRTAAAAAVVVAALAGTAAIAIRPGHTRSLPAGPARPVFDVSGTEARLPGYDTLRTELFAAHGGIGVTMTPDDRPYLVAVSCPTPGHADLTGSSPDATPGTARIACDQPVPGGYEGTLELDASARRALFGAVGRLAVTVDSTGLWAIAVLAPGWPDWVPTDPLDSIIQFDGRARPAGGTFYGWLNNQGDILVNGQCVPGVVLSFRVGATDVGTVRCTAATPNYGVGRGGFGRAGTRVQVTVTRTGLETGQWTVVQAGSPP